jgi:hypothetical protein
LLEDLLRRKELFVDRDARANDNSAGTEDICAKSTPIEQSLHHFRGRQVGSLEPLAEATTRFAQFDTTQTNRTDGEFLTDQRVQANPSGNEISPGTGKIDNAAGLCAERLDFLGFDKRNVLARFVPGREVSITQNAFGNNGLDGLYFDLGLAGLAGKVDAFNGHGSFMHNFFGGRRSRAAAVFGCIDCHNSLRKFPSRDNAAMSRELFRFESAASVADWSAIDDSVMGGVSASRLRHDETGHAVFEGIVSLERNGGFASVRSRPLPLGLPGAVKCVIELRGDGKRYKLNLRSDDAFDGINYQATFEPPAQQWNLLRLPLSTFLPSFRGRHLPSVAPFDPASLRQIGLMIADRQAGPFALAVRSVGLE